MKRQALMSGTYPKFNKWEDEVVYYRFDKDRFDFNLAQSVLLAMEKISNNTCLRFSNEHSWNMLTVTSDKGCQSPIGRIWAKQYMSVGISCFDAGIVVHELIHALGFVHSQQRLDRDQYLNFNLTEWRLSDAFQMMQYAKYNSQLLLVPYDYGSVMQYYDDAKEYEPRDSRYIRTLGSHIVAFYDYLMINNHYGCFCQQTEIDCKNFGYPNPSNCEVCNCPYGFGGDDCSERPEPGETIEASKEWKNMTVSLDAGYSILSDGTKYSQRDYIYHFLWITAPANKTIEIGVNGFTGVECGWGCTNGGIEVKTEKDPRLTSPRACCVNETEVYRSSNNPTIVMLYNLEGRDEYNLSYRYID